MVTDILRTDDTLGLSTRRDETGRGGGEIVEVQWGPVWEKGRGSAEWMQQHLAAQYGLVSSHRSREAQ